MANVEAPGCDEAGDAVPMVFSTVPPGLVILSAAPLLVKRQKSRRDAGRDLRWRSAWRCFGAARIDTQQGFAFLPQGRSRASCRRQT